MGRWGRGRAHTPGKKFKQFDKLFDLVMLNAKQFDKLFGKTQIVWQILTLFGKHLFCLANIIFVWQTFFVWQIHCFYLANTILFGKIIEPIKQFGIQHD